MYQSLIRSGVGPIAVFVACCSLAVTTPAFAAIDPSLGVLANDGFELGSTNNDKISPAPHQVNTDEMFSFSDWFFAQKGFDPGEPISIDVGLQVTQTSVGDNTEGTWMINNIWDTYDDVMIVLKGGNSSNTDPGVYIGYLLQQGDTSGTYNSPFAQENDLNKVKGISHVTVYVRTAAVPEPGTFGLSALALVSMCTARRRARRR
jgi:hypothetical protein